MTNAANTDSALGAMAGDMPKVAELDPNKGMGHNTGKHLEAFLMRVERLEEEKAATMEDIKEVYAEAKGIGFDVKTMRKIVALRKMDVEKRREQEQLLDLYKTAVGIT